MKRTLESKDNTMEPKMKKVKNLIDVEDLGILALNPVRRTVAKLQSTEITKRNIPLWKKNTKIEKKNLYGNFLDSKETTILTESEAVEEALRCLKCADAPCIKSCPSQIDIPSFIYSIGNRNFYGAAKTILSDNPNGLSCGNVCPVSTLCVGACNLKNPINISGLQAFALDVFKRMRIKQIHSPDLDISKLPKSFSAKIALVGCGPSSVSCATYLARMGYSDITIFEKEKFGGGLSISEIPQNRLNYEDVMWEISLMKDLGVKIIYEKKLGSNGFTIDSLKKDGFVCVFLGLGLPQPKMIKQFEGLDLANNFFTSKSFLPLVAKGTKKCCKDNFGKIPKLSGHVIILGAGDTAMDCAASAIRCGASDVTVVLRRTFSEIRAVSEERDSVVESKVNFLTNCMPEGLIFDKDKKIIGLKLKRSIVVKGRVKTDGDESFKLNCDYICSAFGSSLYDKEIIKAINPVKLNDWGLIDVNEGMETNVPYVFAGGDIVGNGSTVEATNDGKTAAFFLHKYIQTKLYKEIISEEPKLPRFYTEIDKVDISVKMCGVQFENPFGFASAPPSTTISMIARGFEQGWGFAVTKSFSMDFDSITNVSPRIVKGTTSGEKWGTHQSSFLNIELISEKSMEYWLEGIKQLKKKYPKKIVVASIMAGYDKGNWITLAKRSQEAGADILELNLSCPHGMGEKGMGLACGQDAKLVRDICSWVKAVAKVPFFAKMTPNITRIVEIAKAAKDGGADGVQCTNTVMGLMGLNSKGVGWPNVNGKTTYGGLSGNAIRPIVLRMISKVSKHLDGYPIMASGGCDSARTALQMIHCGASVCQVSSAIQNQNYAILEDWITGMKSQLWINANSRFDEWDGCSPPSVKLKKKKRDVTYGKGLTKLGEDLLKRRELEMKDIKDNGIIIEEVEDFVELPKTKEPLKVPSVNVEVGRGLKDIGGLMELDPKSENQVVAEIVNDLCVNCGKCYQTCNDCGYQAIEFDKKNHVPKVDEKLCTGCTLCFSVCPINGAIIMVKRDNKVNPYHAKRGIPYGKYGKDSVVLE